MSKLNQVAEVGAINKVVIYIEEIEGDSRPTFFYGHLVEGDEIGFTSDPGFRGEVRFSGKKPLGKRSFKMDGSHSYLKSIVGPIEEAGFFLFEFKYKEDSCSEDLSRNIPRSRMHRLAVAQTGDLIGGLRFWFKREYTSLRIDLGGTGFRSIHIENRCKYPVRFIESYCSLPITLFKNEGLEIALESSKELSLSELAPAQGFGESGGTTHIDIYPNPVGDPPKPRESP